MGCSGCCEEVFKKGLTSIPEDAGYNLGRRGMEQMISGGSSRSVRDGGHRVDLVTRCCFSMLHHVRVVSASDLSSFSSIGLFFNRSF